MAAAVSQQAPQINWSHPASSPAAFGMYIYGHRPAPHHWRWLRQALDPAISRLLIIAPRDSAKTTWIVNVLAAWTIGTFPLRTHFIGSVSDTQASERLKAIKLLIEANAQWREVFPHIVPDEQRGWSEKGLHVWDTRYPYAAWMQRVAKYGNVNTPTLTAGSVGSSTVIGKRITGLAVLDDLHDDKNCLTQLQRDRVWSWVMQTVIPTLTATAKAIAIGTRWQRDDTPGRLKTNAAWVVDETSAITDGQSYWPDYWPIERLMSRKAEIGSAFFRAQYLNDPAGLAGQVFDASWFGFLPDPLPALKAVVLGVDLAISEKQTADYTAIATCAMDADNVFYLLEMQRGHWTMHQTLRRIQAAASQAKARWGRLDLVAVEDVQFQAAVVQELLRTTTLPARGVTPDKDKTTRARAWGIRAEQGRVYADRDATWWPPLADELVDFPTGEHDDQVDAVSVAYHRLTQRPTARQGSLSRRRAGT